MGTDINMVAEVRENGKWKTFDKMIFKHWEGFDFEEIDNIPYTNRNYNVFAILADVRNGCEYKDGTKEEKFNCIAQAKGLPDDICESSINYLPDYGYCNSYLTLKEIFDFDWQQKHIVRATVNEKCYVEEILNGISPNSYCRGAGGGNLKTVSSEIMDKILSGELERDCNTTYYVLCDFPAKTYAEYASDFLKSMEILKENIPEDTSLEDVRIIFNFDC